MRERKEGFILVFALGIITLCMVLVMYVVNKGGVFLPYSRLYTDREQAYLLAYSGIEIAISQLAITAPPPDKEKAGDVPAEQKTAQSQPLSHDQLLLKKIFPTLGSWQTFKLTSEIDGIDGEIKIYLASEDGKIDINGIYDFAKQKFAGEGVESENLKKLLRELFLSIEKQTKTENLFSSFENFLKERGAVINDPTELLLIKEFVPFKNRLFYEPLNKEAQQEKPSFYLTDLFTVWTGKKTVQPWLFSESVLNLLGLKKKESKNIDAFLKNFKPEMQWPAAWNTIFAKLYQKDFANLPKHIDVLLATKFEPKLFSVLSYGLFGQVTQRLLAILERVEKKSTQEKTTEFDIKIRKLYWL